MIHLTAPAALILIAMAYLSVNAIVKWIGDVTKKEKHKK